MGLNYQNETTDRRGLRAGTYLPPPSFIFSFLPDALPGPYPSNRLTPDGRLVRLFVSPPLPLKGFPSSICPSDCLLFA